MAGYIIHNLARNQCSTILKEISPISLKCLRKLVLTNNKISSKQSFHRIMFGSLQMLYLDNNQINSISDLRKLNQSLTSLSINKNYIKTSSVLSLIASTQLRWTTENIVYEDCRDLMKAESKKMNIDIMGWKRIQQNSFVEQIKKKYKIVKVKEFK